MKLISMTEFVLQRSLKDISEYTVIDAFKDGAKVMNEIFSYAKFLNQPLTLGMFVPCDEEGNVLEEKSIFNTTDEDYIFNSDAFDKYQQAKDKVLFEGFEVNKDELKNNGILFWVGKFYGKETIENFTSSNITLTPNAIKKINL